ncbi:beta-ketoacyl-ACP synthase II [Thermoflavimicrobium dichotomicum]|uniref:3-oxoacyl-[acyl-carrier-protein] synthase 2 n=1 Tax=Thermoflavimicrobium dichotomicum TaxID=46223 RepID=A0A1I3MU17_9BACL|nr:beta-ketoacyl-ACP synthase II [Thermoflavimicrobium dichotomicum]SFJ00477.1 3-oxoacyl-[acyl-carrier-protein] synthase II [Thermoflavimicrobium dichotomicum]
MRRRVVITGLGLVTPIGQDSKSFWQGLMSGKSGAGPITRFDPTHYPTRIAAEIKDFRPEDHMDKKEVKRMDLFAQFGMAAARQAIRHASLSVTHELGERMGVMVGTGSGGLNLIQREHGRVLQEDPRRLSPYLASAMLANMASGEIAIATGARGPSAAVVTACATGSSCIGEAMRMIQYGTADIMLAGGTEAPITPLGLAAFSRIRALSRQNEDPRRASRPFDRSRDGFVAGEGAGVIVLEELEHARKRGVPILAELIGYGASTDAYHITSPLPDGGGAVQAMKLALQDAQLTAADIDYINAHGTGTPLNDRIEVMAVKRVFGQRVDQIPISSIKSMTGHLLGAAGAVEMIASVLALQEGWIPPTINWEEADEGCTLDFVPNHPRRQSTRIIMSNSFGFGGHNASLIVKKWEE